MQGRKLCISGFPNLGKHCNLTLPNLTKYLKYFVHSHLNNVMWIWNFVSVLRWVIEQSLQACGDETNPNISVTPTCSNRLWITSTAAFLWWICYFIFYLVICLPTVTYIMLFVLGLLHMWRHAVTATYNLWVYYLFCSRTLINCWCSISNEWCKIV